MLLILIDAVVLVALLQTISNDEADFSTAVIVAVVAAVGTFVLALLLSAALGTFGAVLAAVVAAAAMGVALSALFGVEIKRAFLIAAIFMTVHVGTSVGLSWMLG